MCYHTCETPRHIVRVKDTPVCVVLIIGMSMEDAKWTPVSPVNYCRIG